MSGQIETKLYYVDKNVEEMETCTQIVDAGKLLREGELVAFPTETVYGLGANALSNDAVEKIYKAKGRPSDNPLIVHIADISQLSQVASEVSDQAKKLMEAFWPGPLTIILPKTNAVASLVTAGLNTVGVRMPDHPLALALIKQAGVPIAAPSANRSGRPSPTTAEHVRADLNGRIPCIIDGGSTGVGLESTVIDISAQPPLILRPGGITAEQLEAIIGEVELDPALVSESIEAPRSPGMKYTHYAPQGELWLVDGEAAAVQIKMQELLTDAKRNGRKTGVLATAERASYWESEQNADIVISCGADNDLHGVALNLYASLRLFDDLGVEYIVSSTFPRQGLGAAVMNRLEKAAGGRLIHV